VSENENENTEAAVTEQPHEPHIQVLRGNPSDAELAALITVLGAVGAATPQPPTPESTRWGIPVDRLRFSMSSFQRLTMQQMFHLHR
jgi:hypothetical protein